MNNLFASCVARIATISARSYLTGSRLRRLICMVSSAPHKRKRKDVVERGGIINDNNREKK